MPAVSIIIPCYNHGQYIAECIESIEQIGDKSLYELIIINDGSTDAYTNKILTKYKDDGYNVVFQENQGLATTRNNAIAMAKGKYILPVDADNKIRPEYVYQGIKTLENDTTVAIVYGNAAYFGESNIVFKPGPFNLQKIMLGNYVDACAIYRKEVWVSTGGYDKEMPFAGMEDWAMWIHAAILGYRFKYIDEVLYDYRVLGDSMIRQLNNSKIKNDQMVAYMNEKHQNIFGIQYIDADIMQKFGANPISFISKLILKKYFPTYFSKLVEKGKLRKYV